MQSAAICRRQRAMKLHARNRARRTAPESLGQQLKQQDAGYHRIAREMPFVTRVFCWSQYFRYMIHKWFNL